MFEESQRQGRLLIPLLFTPLHIRAMSSSLSSEVDGRVLVGSVEIRLVEVLMTIAINYVTDRLLLGFITETMCTCLFLPRQKFVFLRCFGS